MPAPKPTKAHLVGSINAPANTDAFKLASTHLGSKLTRFSDGETGHRNNWIMFQFMKMVPRVAKGLAEACVDAPQIEPDPPLSLDEFPETNYDDEAIASYKVFTSLREQGVLPAHAKLQVGIPTLVNFIRPVVQTRYCLATEKHIETRIESALRNIQAAIPHRDLCIQFESPQEIIQLEYERLAPQWQATFKPYITDMMAGFTERFVKFAGYVEKDVEIGVHLCYGDLHHVHFVEPLDSRILVEYANSITTAMDPIHPISFIHVPVPKERDDEEYFVPLKDLQHKGELYLGVVREDDEEGSRRRLDTAVRVLDREFGVSTECGLGRVSEEGTVSAMKILNSLTS